MKTQLTPEKTMLFIAGLFLTDCQQTHHSQIAHRCLNIKCKDLKCRNGEICRKKKSTSKSNSFSKLYERQSQTFDNYDLPPLPNETKPKKNFGLKISTSTSNSNTSTTYSNTSTKTHSNSSKYSLGSNLSLTKIGVPRTSNSSDLIQNSQTDLIDDIPLVTCNTPIDVDTPYGISSQEFNGTENNEHQRNRTEAIVKSLDRNSFLIIPINQITPTPMSKDLMETIRPLLEDLNSNKSIKGIKTFTINNTPIYYKPMSPRLLKSKHFTNLSNMPNVKHNGFITPFNEEEDTFPDIPTIVKNTNTKVKNTKTKTKNTNRLQVPKNKMNKRKRLSNTKSNQLQIPKPNVNNKRNSSVKPKQKTPKHN